MLMQPRKTKYRKAQKGRIHGRITRGAEVSFGEYGLKALGTARLTAKQIEAARRSITNYLKRSGKMWIRVFPNIPVSRKPLEVRMGKGKGAIDFWMCRVKKGRVLFEIAGVEESLVKEAFLRAESKLPMKTTLVAVRK